MNIYIPIEIKARELEGRTLLAITAAERGHNVLIGEKKDTLLLAKRGALPPGIVHMKSITPHEPMKKTLRDLKHHGHIITVQDEESGLLDKSFKTFATLRFSKETLAQVSKVFAWGEFDGESLKEHYPDYANKIDITGSPRVDFWRKEFDGYFEDPSGDFNKKEKPYILVVSNFGSFLNENRMWNIVARLRKAGYFERDENKEWREYENSAYQTRLIGEFIKMIRFLSESFSDLNIIVRPHPIESVEGWQKIIGEFDNVIVKREGTISRWIRHSEMIIHNGCTSALEAATIGIPRIAYRPLPSELERDIPNEISINVFSKDEVIETVSKLLEKNDSETLEWNNELLNKRIANQNGPLAADRIVDKWESLGLNSGMTQTDVSELLSAKSIQKVPFAKKLKRKTAFFKNKIIGKESTSGNSGKLLKSSHKFPDFKEQEIEDLILKMQLTLDRFKTISFERYGEKSFILTGKNQVSHK